MVLASCGSGASSPAQADRALVAGLPVSARAKPLNTGSDSCSPDGGFYVDRTKISFYYMREVPLQDVLPLLSGSEARSARRLAGAGPLIEVVAVARNGGASTCGVGLTQVVLETSSHYGGTAHLVPNGTTPAVQQAYYQPIRPIVVLASNRLNLCSADVNPGASVWLMAVFPPVDAKVPLAVVNPNPQYGFFLPVRRGSLPARPPTSLYSEDVNHCLQVLSAG